MGRNIVQQATRYVEYVLCTCGRKGNLTAEYQLSKSGRWFGPYFRVSHHKCVHDRQRYRAARARGVSSKQALTRARRMIVTDRCYFGRGLPIPITREVRSPRDDPRPGTQRKPDVMQPLELRDHAKGEMHPLAKLTRLKVQAIRDAYRKGKVSQYDLAEQYGLSQRDISDIARGDAWKHLDGSEPIRRPDYPQLSPEQVAHVRLEARKVKLGQLAKELNVSESLISCIVKNRLYRDPLYSPPTEHLRPSRLDNAQVAIIRKLASEGVSIADIAEKFAINYSHAWKLVQDCPYHVRQPKFTSEQIRTIRERYAKGDVTQPQLAEEFNVSFQMISNITRRISYRDTEKRAA